MEIKREKNREKGKKEVKWGKEKGRGRGE